MKMDAVKREREKPFIPPLTLYAFKPAKRGGGGGYHLLQGASGHTSVSHFFYLLFSSPFLLAGYKSRSHLTSSSRAAKPEAHIRSSSPLGGGGVEGRGGEGRGGGGGGEGRQQRRNASETKKLVRIRRCVIQLNQALKVYRYYSVVVMHFLAKKNRGSQPFSN